MLYVFGDIHGRMDLLEKARHVIRVRGDATRLIFLGDYVDRGPQSREVVEAVMELHRQGEIALKGNHEQMMVDSWRIANYGALSKMWVSNGGKQTLKSYGAGDNAWNAQWDMIPQEHIDWMDGLPTMHVAPGRVFVHAGLMPGIPLDQQDEEWTLWIRDRFLLGKPGDFTHHVIHGHTHTVPVFKEEPSEPELLPHRTNLDTGAFFTGVLGVGVFDPDETAGPVEVLKITV